MWILGWMREARKMPEMGVLSGWCKACRAMTRVERAWGRCAHCGCPHVTARRPEAA